MNGVDDWVLGSKMELSGLGGNSLRAFRRSEVSQKIGATLKQLSGIRGTPSACVVSKSGWVYYGVPQKQSHPNCFGSAVEVATGIACTSGSQDLVLAAVHYPGTDEKHPGFSGLDLERLAEHFCEGREDMTLMQVFDKGESLYSHKSRLPLPWSGRSRKRKLTEVRAATEQLGKEFNVDFLLRDKFPRHTLEYLKRQLRLLICNSTADGVTRPGRKRHAACVFTKSGRVYYGVNLRSDTEGCDRCSEWNALGAAFLGGDDQKIVGACVYSPDYGMNSQLACCGKCLNSLGGCIDPDIGDMVVVYFENTRPDRIQKYSGMPNISYAQAEGLMPSR